MTNKILASAKTTLAAMAVIASCTLQAQTTSNQPITLIIPYPPGGSADMLARPMLPELQKNSAKQSFLITKLALAVRSQHKP